MKARFNLSQKGLLLVCVPLLFQIVFVASLFVLLKQTEREVERQSHARSVLAALNQINRSVIECATQMGTYLIIPSTTQLERYDTYYAKIPPALHDLEVLLAANPNKVKAIAQIKIVGRRIMLQLDEARQRVADNDRESLRQSLRDFRQLSQELTRNTSELEEEERAIVEMSPSRQLETNKRLQTILLIGIIFNIALAMALAVYFSSGTVARLKILMDNTRLLSAGKPLHAPVGGTDEIAHLDAVFHEMAENLEIARKKERAFFAMISHDLRTPLTSVRAFLTMLERGIFGSIGSDGQKHLGGAINSASRLIKIVNDLLDIEKISAGHMQMEPQRIDLDQVTAEAITSVSALAEQSGITLTSAPTNLTVLADPSWTSQVLVNLLSNAIRHSPQGGQVSLSGSRQDGLARIAVADNGPGIAEQHRQTIFKPFEQVPATNGTRQGTGLGLAICKAVVEQHGGTIGVDSAEGRGSTFWFTLPLADKQRS